MMTESQKLAIKLDKDIAKIIDSSERKKLVDAYLKLFSGFAWVNWTKKQSLGRAWQSALGQCAGFLKTKDKNNPVTKYLNNVADAHKKCWSRVIMTHKDSPNTLDKTPDETERLQKHGTKLIRESMDIIKLIMARHNVRIMEITGIEKTSAKVSENQKPKQAAQITQEKPVPQVQMPQQQTQIPKLNSATDKQIVQQRINLFILAKYNQKTA